MTLVFVVLALVLLKVWTVVWMGATVGVGLTLHAKAAAADLKWYLALSTAQRHEALAYGATLRSQS